jgi:hypothetical protein
VSVLRSNDWQKFHHGKDTCVFGRFLYYYLLFCGIWKLVGVSLLLNHSENFVCILTRNPCLYFYPKTLPGFSPRVFAWVPNKRPYLGSEPSSLPGLLPQTLFKFGCSKQTSLPGFLPSVPAWILTNSFHILVPQTHNFSFLF